MASNNRRDFIIRSSLGMLSLGTGLGLNSTSVFAQTANTDYPSRPIKIIVPLSAGGGGDLTARQVAMMLSQRLGQPVIVENRPGGGGSIGTHAVIKSEPDGYTLVMLSSSHTCNAALRELPFDSINDITPISLLKKESLILVANPKLQANNLQEVIELAKREPGKITYGSSGLGGISHLSMEHMAELAGVKMTHVPYKGTAPALQDVIAGNVDLLFSSVAVVVPVIQGGRAKGIAIADKRIPALPDVPSFTEAGLPAFKSDLWHAVAGPKNLPPEIVARLNQELELILQSPEMQERIAAEGSQPVGGSPAQLDKAIREGIAQWKHVIKVADIKPE